MPTNEFLRQKLKKSLPPHFSSKALPDKQMQSRIKKISFQLILAIVEKACEICICISRKKKSALISLKKEVKSGCRQTSIRNVLYSSEEFYYLCIPFETFHYVINSRNKRDFSLLSCSLEIRASHK